MYVCMCTCTCTHTHTLTHTHHHSAIRDDTILLVSPHMSATGIMKALVSMLHLRRPGRYVRGCKPQGNGGFHQWGYPKMDGL